MGCGRPRAITAHSFCFFIFRGTQQDAIDKSGFLGSLLGTTQRLRHAWGTLIDKIDRLIRGHKISWEKRETSNHTSERGFSLCMTRTEAWLATNFMFGHMKDTNTWKAFFELASSWMEEGLQPSSAGFLCRERWVNGKGVG